MQQQSFRIVRVTFVVAAFETFLFPFFSIPRPFLADVHGRRFDKSGLGLRVDYSNVCGTCAKKERRKTRDAGCIVPLSRSSFWYVWKRMDKGKMNLRDSQAIGRRPDRRINSF